MAHLYCNGGNRFNYVSIRNYTQNNFGGGYSYGCSMPSFGGIFSNWGTGIYNGCACNSGFNWSTFWGTGCGSLVGSFLGMLCRPNNTSGSNQGQGTTGNNGNDTDYKKINDLIKEINKDKNLINAQTKINSLTENDKTILKATLYRYREKIQNLRDNLDNKMDNENKRQLDNLEAQIDKLDEKFKINSKKSPEIWLTSEQKEGEQGTPATDKTTDQQATDAEGTQPTSGNDTDTTAGSNENEKNKPVSIPFEQEHKLSRTLTEPTGITWNKYDDENEMIHENWKLPKDFTALKPEEIENGKIIKVEEFKGETIPIDVDTCKVSVAVKSPKGYPEYLQIKSKTGRTWNYKYAGEKDGCPIYITPNSDENKNVYVLCKQGEDYKLMQFDGFSGYSKGDHQNKK